MEYSKDISSLLGGPKSPPSSAIEDPKTVLQVNLPSFIWVFRFQVIMTRRWCSGTNIRKVQ